MFISLSHSLSLPHGTFYFLSPFSFHSLCRNKVYYFLGTTLLLYPTYMQVPSQSLSTNCIMISIFTLILARMSIFLTLSTLLSLQLRRQESISIALHCYVLMLSTSVLYILIFYFFEFWGFAGFTQRHLIIDLALLLWPILFHQHNCKIS